MSAEWKRSQASVSCLTFWVTEWSLGMRSVDGEAASDAVLHLSGRWPLHQEHFDQGHHQDVTTLANWPLLTATIEAINAFDLSFSSYKSFTDWRATSRLWLTASVRPFFTRLCPFAKWTVLLFLSLLLASFSNCSTVKVWSLQPCFRTCVLIKTASIYQENREEVIEWSNSKLTADAGHCCCCCWSVSSNWLPIGGTTTLLILNVQCAHHSVSSINLV